MKKHKQIEMNFYKILANSTLVSSVEVDLLNEIEETIWDVNMGDVETAVNEELEVLVNVYKKETADE